MLPGMSAGHPLPLMEVQFEHGLDHGISPEGVGISLCIIYATQYPKTAPLPRVSAKSVVRGCFRSSPKSAS